MEIECNWTRNDVRKYLVKKRRLPNIILFILGILFFLYVTFYGFLENAFDNKVLVICFFVYILVLAIFLFLITELYVAMKLRRNDKKTNKAYGTYQIKVDEKGITSQVNDNKVHYLWSDISRYRFSKKYFFLATYQDKLGLYFRKEVLKDQYENLLSYVKTRISRS